MKGLIKVPKQNELLLLSIKHSPEALNPGAG